MAHHSHSQIPLDWADEPLKRAVSASGTHTHCSCRPAEADAGWAKQREHRRSVQSSKNDRNTAHRRVGRVRRRATPVEGDLHGCMGTAQVHGVRRRRLCGFPREGMHGPRPTNWGYLLSTMRHLPAEGCCLWSPTAQGRSPRRSAVKKKGEVSGFRYVKWVRCGLLQEGE